MWRSRHINSNTSLEEILVLIRNEHANDAGRRHACCICSSGYFRRFLSDDWKLFSFVTRRHFNCDDVKLPQANDVAWGVQEGAQQHGVCDELEALFDVGSDADMEDGEEDEVTSSSRHDDPSVGSRRPHEDDSDASSSKRSRSGSDRPLADAGPLSSPRSGGDPTPSGVVASRTAPVRDPTTPTPSEIEYRFGSTAPPSQYALYSCSGINDDDATMELDFDPATYQRRDYYVGLFHEVRWYGNKKPPRTKGSEHKFDCADVFERWRWAQRSIENCKRLQFSPKVTPFGGFGGGGLRTPSPFPERPASGRSAAPTYRGSEEILTNEYENDPDLGSGSDDQQFAGRSSEFPPVHLAVGVEAAGRRRGSGPPDLVDRLEAVERLQSAEFAALRQDLAPLKAQLAQVWKTTSNVQVDLGSRALPSEVPRRQDSPNVEADPSSLVAPAPTESKQPLRPQHARAQTQSESEPPSRCSSADQSPEPSADAGGSPGATFRQSSNPTKPMKPATLQSPRSEATLRPAEILVSAKPATLQSRGSEATLRPTETTFAEMVCPRFVDASGARRSSAEGIVDHETRRTRAMDSVAKSRRTCATETYYRVRWLGLPPAEDTWEPRERLMEDIPDVVKEYEATLALVFDDGSLDHNHDRWSVIAQAYPRHEPPGNDAAVVTSISNDVPVKSRGASRRDEGDDDHTRDNDMDVSATTSTATRVADRSHPVAPAAGVREGVGTTDRRLTRPNLPSGPADAMDCQLGTQCLHCVRLLPRSSLQSLFRWDSTQRG
ncbi:unnamed protein product [Phytophthora fragariaefolia]|uniref:Unnamed protein product n=1 Tax=Phytophthora fragariaefolia TaxID=1490495 RepID=A0A9W6XW61_9STRA|nr:unnamed protein product [Phytophthora fragariaefolia]